MSRACYYLSFVACALLLPCASASEEEKFTFFVTSDSHFEAVEKVERNDRVRVTIERMNTLPGVEWPAKLGGGTIGKPKGVLVLGDLIDDGDKKSETALEWAHFTEQFGLDGTDGLLKYPVFEGWGNHDGPPEAFIKQKLSVQGELKRRNQQRLAQKLISNVSANGLHYSWDWNDIHFVQTNLYPADRQHPSVRYGLPWHDPQQALQFLKDDLAQAVGDSGRPVIVVSHCGFDTDWWSPEDWVALYTALRPYNVLAYFHGHSGTGIKKYQPEGEPIAWDVINTGQTEKGFFVVEVDRNRLRCGFHVKKDTAALKDVEWEWKYLFEKPVQRMAKSVNPTSASAAATETRFAVIGDFGLDNYKPKSGEKNEAAQRNPFQAGVANLVKSWNPDFVVTTGDNNYPRGEASTIDENIGKYYSEFIGNYQGKFGKGSEVNRFFPVLGNHDWAAPKVGCQAHIDYFTLPGNERYYEFKQGPLHFFMLDSDGHEPDGVRIDSKQFRWFQQAIAASDLPFQVVVAHHPPFSSGEHGDNAALDWSFEKYGVDLMLCGHDHNYERIERKDVTYVVNGAGGANLRTFRKSVEGSQVRYRDMHGAMLFETASEQGRHVLRAKFVNREGKTIDEFKIERLSP